MDEDFIIAVNARKITTKAQVSSFGSSSSSSAHASNSASSSKGSALIDITGLEASIEALERESFVENSRTVLLARSIESDRALEQAKAGVLKAVQVYRAIREKGSSEGPAITKKKVAQGSAGEREVPAPPLPIAASASSVSKKRSFAASSDSSIEKKGQPPTKKAAIANPITASLPATIMPTAVTVASKNLDVISTADNTDFFVPLERGIALLDVVRQQLENTQSDIADEPSQSGGLLPSEIAAKISTSSGSLESEQRQGILSSDILELVYWYWRKKRSTEAQVVQKQHLKNLKEANQEMNQSSVNENFARCGFLLRSHQTVAPGDLPSEASVNVLARIIGLDRVAVAKVPSHSKGASSVPSVAAAKILADAAAAAKKRTAAGGVDGIDDHASVDPEAPPPLTLFLSRTGVVSDRLRTKDVESNLRALIRMRTLRQHLERLRLLLDLARRREKLRRARLHMISDAIEAVLPVKRSSSSSTISSSSSSAIIAPPISISGAEFFDYATSAAATAIPSQGRVRTPQLQSQMSETIAARAITYPRRRNQGRLTTWVNGNPPMYRHLLQNPVYEEAIAGGGGGDGGNGSGEGGKQKGEVLVEALRTSAPSPIHPPAVTARSSSQCSIS